MHKIVRPGGILTTLFGKRALRLRLLIGIALLAVAALEFQAAVATYSLWTRGVSPGFPDPIVGADVPLLGVNVALEQYDAQELEQVLDRIVAGGFTWVRQSFYWSRIEPEMGRFDWAASDRIMEALARRPELRLVAVLDDDPPTPPADPDCFAAFASAFASRYGDQVTHYQVWDEPNLAAHWGGASVSPPAYADLLARTAQAIRAADPDACILLAGLAPTVETGPQNLSDVRYLDQLYQAGAAPYFDLVAGKPYGFDAGPDDRRADEQTLNFARLILLREVMEAHHDASTAVWASHWGWNALPPGWTGAPSIWGQTDEATQAAYTIAALERARSEWPWVGALILETYQPAAPADDAHWGFALVGQDGVPRPVYEALAAWAAALPDAAPPGGYPAQNRWTSYEGEWRLGPLGADVGASGGRAVFRFDGTSVAVTVRRGPAPAFLYVTVDGEPSHALPVDEMGRAYVALYDREPTVTTVPLATGLAAGPHTVEVAIEGGVGQWTLVDWRVGVEAAGKGELWRAVGWAAIGTALMLLAVHDIRRVGLAAWGRVICAWPEWAQTALAAGLAGAFWTAAALSWGYDWGSPWLLVSLFLLILFAWFSSLRPDLGLALVACAAPFYLYPGAMFYRAVSLPEALLLACAVGAALRGRALEKGGMRWRPLDYALSLLLIAAVVAGAAAADKKAALFELRAVFLAPALYYARLRRTRLDERGRWRIIDGWVVGAVGVALVGLVQYAMGRGVAAEGGLLRLRSVYFSPNNVGLYLERVWPVLVAVWAWGFFRARRRGARWMLYALALGLVTLALALSFSRGALWLGLPAAILVMGWRAGGRWRLTALFAVGVLALILLLPMPRLASVFDLSEGSTFFRLQVWRSSLALIRDHFWLGVGPGNFVSAYRTRYVLPSAWAEPNLEHPHSLYLDHWTRLGLLGLLAGAAVQIAFWRQLRRWRLQQGRNAALMLGLAGGMAALLAHGLVDNALFFPDLALTFALMAASACWLSPLVEGGGVVK